MSNRKYTDFSLWLKKKREKAGLSKASLAEKAGVSAAYIGQLENMTEDKKRILPRAIMWKHQRVAVRWFWMNR
jgi:transcriptional regulator with XRE-family HTH domain